MSKQPYASSLNVMHAMRIIKDTMLMANVYPRGSITIEVNYTDEPTQVTAHWTDHPTGNKVMATLTPSGGVSMRWDD